MLKKILIIMATALIVAVSVISVKADDTINTSGVIASAVNKGSTAVITVDLAPIEYDEYTLTIASNFSGYTDLTDLITDNTGTNIQLSINKATLTASKLTLSYPIAANAAASQLQVALTIHQVVAEGVTGADDTVINYTVDLLAPAGNTNGAVSGNTASSAKTAVNSQLVYNGSDQNYLTSLAVSGYQLTPSFNKTCTTYFLTVAADVSSLTIKAACSSGAKYVIWQPVLKTGSNKILITVTAADDSQRIYRIIVTKEG